MFWKSLKSNNVFSKTIVIQPIFHKPENPTNIILCQCHVFGPMPKNNKNSSGFNSWAEPPNSDPEECGWFAAMGVLKSDGILDFLLQSDGSLIYSIDITKFLCSEIQIVDASIFQSDKFLFLGILPELREQMQVSSNENCFVDNTRAFSRSRRLTPQQLYLRFPLRIDLEDWFVALNSFAMPDVLSLLGTDKSNELRISNRFKISILEANLDDLKIDDPCLYAEVNIWDHVMARTSIVQNSKSPFWREEFDFNYSVKTKILHINIRNCSHANAPSKNDKIVGKIQITQEMINDSNLNKETRLPVFAHSNKNFQIGTICIKVISSLNFVLQPNNFAKFEQVLTNVALPKISNYMCDSNFAKNLKLEDISLVFLDIFQAINREDDWFQAVSYTHLDVYKRQEKGLVSPIQEQPDPIKPAKPAYILESTPEQQSSDVAGKELSEKISALSLDSWNGTNRNNKKIGELDSSPSLLNSPHSVPTQTFSNPNIPINSISRSSSVTSRNSSILLANSATARKRKKKLPVHHHSECGGKPIFGTR